MKRSMKTMKGKRAIGYGLISVILLTGWIFRSAWLPEDPPVPPHPKIRPDPGGTSSKANSENPFSPIGKPPMPRDNPSLTELDTLILKIRRNQGNVDAAMEVSLYRLAETDPMGVLEALAPLFYAFPENHSGWLARVCVIGRAGTHLREDQWPVWLEKLKSYPVNIQDELLSHIAQAFPPARGQEAYDLSLRIKDEAEAAIAGGEVLSRWIRYQPDQALELVDQVLAFGPGSWQMQRFAEGWAWGDFPGFLQWVQNDSNSSVAVDFAGIVARHAMMAQDYEMAARNAWKMEENEHGERADLLETLRGIPEAHPALVKLNIPLKSLPAQEGKP